MSAPLPARFLQKNEFECSIDADESFDDVPIFKLLLQPMAENSIKHGIAIQKEDGQGTLATLTAGILTQCELEEKINIF